MNLKQAQEKVQEPGEQATYNTTALAWAFVLIWGMGFVASKTGLQHAQPFTFLFMRFALGLVCVGAVLWWLKPLKSKWPREPRLWLHILIAGLLIHPLHLAGSHYGQALGLSAGAVALVMATQPLLTVLVAPVLGDVTTWRQRVGVAIGFAGVALVVWHKLDANMSTSSGLFAVAIGAMSLTAGSLYQRHFCRGVDPWTNATIQFAAALVLLAPLAYVFEGGFANIAIRWSWPLALSLLYLVVLGSIVAINVLNYLMRHGDATKTSSMIYFTPVVTVIGEYLIYRVVPGAWTLLGMIVTCVGVAFVVSKRR
jgi:drug/metabolite transporter (DMT)-like permease